MIKTPKATIISVYFGKLPYYFEFTKKTIQHNKNFQWIIAGDMFPEKIEDGNILFLPFSLNDLSVGCSRVLNAIIEIKTPYKACDTKILWPEIFEEYINSDWVGWADLDCIFGDLDYFLTEEALREHDVVTYLATSVYGINVPSVHGPFTLINNIKIKKWYLEVENLIDKLNYDPDLNNTKDKRTCYVGLDEFYFAQIIEKKEYKIYSKYKPFKDKDLELPLIFNGRRRAPAKWINGKILVESIQQDYQNRFKDIHSMFLHIRGGFSVDIENNEVLPEALYFYKNKSELNIFTEKNIYIFIREVIPTLKYLHTKIINIKFIFNEENYQKYKKILDLLAPEIKIELTNTKKINELEKTLHLTQIAPSIIEEMRVYSNKKHIKQINKKINLWKKNSNYPYIEGDSMYLEDLTVLDLLYIFSNCEEINSNIDIERNLIFLRPLNSNYVDYNCEKNEDILKILKNVISITAQKIYYTYKKI